MVQCDCALLYVPLKGAKQGGGLGGSQPLKMLVGGVEHLSTLPDFEIFIRRGEVGSP